MTQTRTIKVEVTEEELAVLRWIAKEGKSSAPYKDALLDDFHRSQLRACEHAGLVEVNDRVFLTPFGLLVLAAEPVDELKDAVARKELIDAVEMCWGYFDQCCIDQRNMVPNADGMRRMLRAALDAAKGEKG